MFVAPTLLCQVVHYYIVSAAREDPQQGLSWQRRKVSCRVFFQYNPVHPRPRARDPFSCFRESTLSYKFSFSDHLFSIANYSRVCNFRSKRRTNKNDARVRQFFYFFFLRVQAMPRTKKGQASMCPPPTCPPGRRVFTCVAGLVQLKQRCRVFD